jgi:histidine triad (HIT) family protein
MENQGIPEGKCIFCEVARGRAEAHLIHEDTLSLAFLDINPLAEGHWLVIPKRHVPWWHDLTEEETTSLFRAARLVSGKIMQAFHPDFVCMYARGRRIPHTHIFLVPSHQGDPLEGFQEAPEALNQLKQPERMRETALQLK